jgi:acetyl-CoA acyltransferase
MQQSNSTNVDGPRFPRDVVIVDAARTPLGRAHKGAMSTVRPDDLAAFIVGVLLTRNAALPREAIDDVIGATAFPEGEQGYNIGRVVAQRVGLPDHVAGMQLNRWCASGLESVATAHAKIHAGMAEVIVAFGVESMTCIPLGGKSFTPNPYLAKNQPGMYLGMGLTAEKLVDQHEISREDQDAFALRSHQKAFAAEDSGAFADERVPYPLEAITGVSEMSLEIDECPRRDTSVEGLAKLRAVFREGGTVTAGNSSPLTDGAAAVLLMTDAKRRELGLPILGRLRSYAAAGVAPEIMGIGPVAALPKALDMAGWQQDDVECFELNEAFAAQSIAVIRELGLDEAKVNPNGGAIALGHPLGCTGARLVATLLHHMKREGQSKGVVTMCVGGGQGAAGCFERSDDE